MSKSPRIDAEAFDITTGKPDIDVVVMADFARELERENAALRADKERLDWLEKHGATPICSRAAIDAARKGVQP